MDAVAQQEKDALIIVIGDPIIMYFISRCLDDARKSTADICVIAPQTYKFPPLKENLKADVVVIGAGMFGMNIAYKLSKEGGCCRFYSGRSLSVCFQDCA